jgi:hypothetical protein
VSLAVSTCVSIIDSSIDSQYDPCFHVVVYIGSHTKIPASATMGKTVAKGEKKSIATDAPSNEGEFGSEYL